MKKIVVIGGGTGIFTVLSGLKNYPYKLTAIVAMTDDGGSSGVLREEFGILPPGDIRRALVALSPMESKLLSKLFTYRFKNGVGLKGHCFGNLFLTALEKITGSFNKAIKEAGNILNIKGEVIPVTLENTRLIAELENGNLVIGEKNIDFPKHNGCLKIKSIFLNPSVKVNQEALRAIKKADVIIIGPGDLYTSIIANFLPQGIVQVIKKSSAIKIYLCNIMTKYGETIGFTALDFLKTIEKYLGKGVIDYFIINTTKPKEIYLKKYRRKKAQPVTYSLQELKKISKPKIVLAQLLRKGPLLRHDSHKLAKVIHQLVLFRLAGMKANGKSLPDRFIKNVGC